MLRTSCHVVMYAFRKIYAYKYAFVQLANLENLKHQTCTATAHTEMQQSPGIIFFSERLILSVF